MHYPHALMAVNAFLIFFFNALAAMRDKAPLLGASPRRLLRASRFARAKALPPGIPNLRTAINWPPEGAEWPQVAGAQPPCLPAARHDHDPP